MCNHHPKLYGTLPLKLFDKLMITVSAQLDVSLLDPLTMISAYLEMCPYSTLLLEVWISTY